jgi:hypothetical protein
MIPRGIPAGPDRYPVICRRALTLFGVLTIVWR